MSYNHSHLNKESSCMNILFMVIVFLSVVALLERNVSFSIKWYQKSSQMLRLRNGTVRFLRCVAWTINIMCVQYSITENRPPLINIVIEMSSLWTLNQSRQAYLYLWAVNFDYVCVNKDISTALLILTVIRCVTRLVYLIHKFNSVSKLRKRKSQELFLKWFVFWEHWE